LAVRSPAASRIIDGPPGALEYSNGKLVLEIRPTASRRDNLSRRACPMSSVGLRRGRAGSPAVVPLGRHLASLGLLKSNVNGCGVTARWLTPKGEGSIEFSHRAEAIRHRVLLVCICYFVSAQHSAQGTRFEPGPCQASLPLERSIPVLAWGHPRSRRYKRRRLSFLGQRPEWGAPTQRVRGRPEQAFSDPSNNIRPLQGDPKRESRHGPEGSVQLPNSVLVTWRAVMG
jgi:hypothetical protein